MFTKSLNKIEQTSSFQLQGFLNISMFFVDNERWKVKWIVFISHKIRYFKERKNISKH